MKKVILMSLVVVCSLYARSLNPITAVGDAVSGVVQAGGEAGNTKIDGSVKQSSNVKVKSLQVAGDDNSVGMGNNEVRRGTKIKGSLTQESKVDVGTAKINGNKNDIQLGNNGI